MITINSNFEKLPEAYLFTEIARRVARYQAEHPEADIIKMGIGDVTIPMADAVVEAMHRAVDDEANATNFHGYGPEQGYAFLRDAVAAHDYQARGCDIAPDEIFIGDGAKSDLGNILDILGPHIRVAVTDPVYPVYVDTNVMAGHAGHLLDNGCWSDIEYLPCNAENGFVPSLPSRPVDVVYLCYPNNPTGTTLSREQLKQWVDYAVANGVLILYDSAYEAFITDPEVPHSIFEIEGARQCAIEFRSFSKTAGFTGVRCGYTVVPREVKGVDDQGREVELRKLWLRRQCTKFNGASYVSQRGAAAIYTERGRREIENTIEAYLATSRKLLHSLREAGFTAFGGDNSPYVWMKTPDGVSSWEFFDRLLSDLQIVCTPGSGFGPSGEGYVRFTAFNVARADDACARLATLASN